MFVVGTAFAIPGEYEPRTGRILVFSVSDGTLVLVWGVRGYIIHFYFCSVFLFCVSIIPQEHKHEVAGAVYSIEPFVGGRIVCGINAKVGGGGGEVTIKARYRIFYFSMPYINSYVLNTREGKHMRSICRGRVLKRFGSY